VLDTSHKDERSHILGFVGDSPAHKESPYGTACVLPPPPPPRSCVAVTRTLPGGQVQTTLGDEVPACYWTPTVDQGSATAMDEGYSSRPPSYVVCAGAPVRRGDVTSGHTGIYAVRRGAAAQCCSGDYSCCHTQLGLHHHHHHHHKGHLYQQPPQQQVLDDLSHSPDSDAEQLRDVDVCQSSAGDDATTTPRHRNICDMSAIDAVSEQTDGQRAGSSLYNVA